MNDIAQIGVSDSADFELNTWTVSFDDQFRVSAGRHAILKYSDYAELLKQRDELLDALLYVQKQIESGQEIAMSQVNSAIRSATA